MTTPEFLQHLSRLGITVEARGERLGYAPRSAVTPDLERQLRVHKAALLAHLAGEPYEPRVSEEANEAYWRELKQEDLDHLLGPRDVPVPCPWCGGRIMHSAGCKEMLAEWAPVMPFGKYRGRRACEVPRSYINWIFDTKAGDEELRAELTRWLSTQ